MRLIKLNALILLLPFLLQGQWQKIADGLYLGRFTSPEMKATKAPKITIVKINPGKFQFKLLSVSQLNHRPLTARQWAKRYRLIAVTNAGMFATDFKTHVGYMKNFEHINNSQVNHYRSVAAFNPYDSDKFPFMIFDLDRISFDQILKDYQCLIQNLRLIRRPRENRWKPQSRRWSEAALGQDKNGNVLLIFSRAPRSMYDFNNLLLSLPIDLVCAQHLEGGPEASLFFKYGDVEMRLMGSYETGFNENDDNGQFWPLPNVLGVTQK
ncbi:phosphodiester glycosidase family protein [Calditrichota bacterium LG25]